MFLFFCQGMETARWQGGVSECLSSPGPTQTGPEGWHVEEGGGASQDGEGKDNQVRLTANQSPRGKWDSVSILQPPQCFRRLVQGRGRSHEITEVVSVPRGAETGLGDERAGEPL